MGSARKTPDKNQGRNFGQFFSSLISVLFLFAEP